MKNSINIYDFIDYREFLSSYIEQMQEVKSSWSLNAFANLLGAKNGSTIFKILNEERNLGNELTKKICNYFNFLPEQEEYFRDLIKLDQFSKSSTIYKLVKRGLKSKLEDTKVRNVEMNRDSSNSSIWYYILRVLIENKILDPETYKLKEELYVCPPSNIQQIVADLKREKLLIKKDGKLILSDEHLETLTSTIPGSLCRTHINMLEFTIETFKNIDFNKENLYSSNYTVSLTEEDYKELRNELAETIRVFVNECSGKIKSQKKVYQLQFQLYPLIR